MTYVLVAIAVAVVGGVLYALYSKCRARPPESFLPPGGGPGEPDDK